MRSEYHFGQTTLSNECPAVAGNLGGTFPLKPGNPRRNYFSWFFMSSRSYIQKAKKVIIALSKKSSFRKPILLLIMGVPGAGKSTLARKIAQQFPFYYAAADNIRVALCAQPDHCKVETYETYTTMYAVAEKLLKEGKSVLIDATLAKKEYRTELQQRFGGKAMIILVFLHTSKDTIQKRLQRRKENLSDPTNISFAINKTLLDRFLKELEPPKKDEADVIFTFHHTTQKDTKPLYQFLSAFL
jgi:predicted kinase